MTPFSEPGVAVSLREAVRSSTHLVHVQLEKRLDVEHGEWSVERYASFLRGTLAVVGPTESLLTWHLKPFVTASPAADTATGRLTHDLAALGPIENHSALPMLAAPLPDVGDVATAFGAAYVLEGSRLGGQIIARHLMRRLGLRPEQLTYLTSEGASVATRWRGFCDALDAFGVATNNRARRAVVDAAAATFVSLERALEQAGALDVG